MSAQPPVTQAPPPPAAVVVGTPGERRASIYEGMTAILDQVIAEKPHIRYALAMDTPEIRAANRALAEAVNRFISGTHALRKDVRPFFDRAVAEYLRAADAIVLVLSAAVNLLACEAIRDHPYMNLAAESEEIDRAAVAFMRERDRMRAGDCDPEALKRTLYELVAAHCAAETPDDLPVEPADDAA